MNWKLTLGIRKPFLFAVSTLVLATLGCAAILPQNRPTPTPTPVRGTLPETEADVPRITAEEANAAYDSGSAIIVDVRDTDAYAASHITGALSMPLSQIEADPGGLDLDKEQWIITYCT